MNVSNGHDFSVSQAIGMLYLSWRAGTGPGLSGRSMSVIRGLQVDFGHVESNSKVTLDKKNGRMSNGSQWCAWFSSAPTHMTNPISRCSEGF